MKRIVKPKVKAMTAGELLEQRERDPKHRELMRELESQRMAALEEFNLAAAPLMAELARAGFEVNSLAMLATSDAYKDAVPILAKWLVKASNPQLKEAIGRALSVPWARSAAGVLVAEFRKAPESANGGLKWAIGSALEVLASEELLEDLIELVQDKRHGTARQMPAIGLGKTKNPRAIPVLISLLEDDEVAGHAVMGLGKLKAIEALPFLERFVSHPKVWIRREAAKAIRKIKQEP
jgi:HEAT repeat protein